MDDYKNIDVYKKLISEDNASTIYTLLGRAVTTMSAKEFLDFSKQLESIITNKRIWANLLNESNGFGKLPKDSEISGEGNTTSDYHKNLARVARLADGASFSELDKSRGYDPELDFDSANPKSQGLTGQTKKMVNKYKSGVVLVDDKITKNMMLKKKIFENTNS